jgi:hypothetical protein
VTDVPEAAIDDAARSAERDEAPLGLARLTLDLIERAVQPAGITGYDYVKCPARHDELGARESFGGLLALGRAS